MAITFMRRRGAHTRTAADTVPPTDRPAGYDRPVAHDRPLRYHRPVGVAFTGLLAVLVGAWGAIAGYIGPYFQWHPVAAHVWTANLQNGLLHLLPGAAAVAAGLMLMLMGPARRSVRGGAFVLPAIILIASGAWFVIGPIAWAMFESSPPWMAAGPGRHLLDVAASSFAPGLILVMLGGMALKAAAVPPVMVEDPYTPAEAGMAGRPAVDSTTAGAPVATERDMAGRDVARRDMAERDVARRDMAGRDMAGRDTAGRDMAGREVAGEDAAGDPAPGVPVTGTGQGVHPMEDRTTAAAEPTTATERPEV
jgi:hypothetical protein